MLTDEQIERYARQLVIPGWGEEIQERLSESSVLIIGAGGAWCCGHHGAGGGRCGDNRHHGWR